MLVKLIIITLLQTRKWALGAFFIVIQCNINQHSEEETYLKVPGWIYLFFSVYNAFFSLQNLSELDALMLTVCSSHSLPIQGANAIRQRHCLWRAPKMLIIKSIKRTLASTFLLFLPGFQSSHSRWGTVLGGWRAAWQQCGCCHTASMQGWCPAGYASACSPTSSCCWVSESIHTSGVASEQSCRRAPLLRWSCCPSTFETGLLPGFQS